MPEEKGQSSWSLSYITLTIILSLLTGIIGYGLKYVFERPERRTLTISENQTDNLLNVNPNVNDEIVTSHKLKNSPESVKSYFRYSATIQNTGDTGVENLKIFMQVDHPNITLIKAPTITTKPSNIQQSITFQQNKNVTEANKDEWEVSLLNRNESISFTYIGYSINKIDNVKFSLVARKKDWEMVRLGAEGQLKGSIFRDRTIAEMRGEDIIVILAMFAAINMSLNMYLMILAPFLERLSKRLLQSMAAIKTKGDEE